MVRVMRIRTILAAAVALGLLTAACGDSKDKYKSLSGAAVATTTTAPSNATIPAGYPGTTTLDATVGFGSHPAPMKPWGALYEFSVNGGAQYAVDSPAADVDGSPRGAVGIPTSFTWSQNLTAPMTLVMRTSAATASKLTALSGTEAVSFVLVFLTKEPTANDFFFPFSYRGDAKLRGKPVAKAVTPVTNFKGVKAGPMEVTLNLGPPLAAGTVIVQHDGFSSINKKWQAK
jgi:hypothetical protein